MDGGALPARHRLDVDAYYRMAEAGIIGAKDRIELIDGDLIDMAPIGPDHAAAVIGLNEALFIACAGRAMISPQNPVRLNLSNEPQPDLVLLRRRADYYRTGERAGPGDVLLLVEVADSSLRFDRDVKLPLYARAGIQEVWIVNLRDRMLEVHRAPAGDRYTEHRTHAPDETVSPLAFPDGAVKLDIVFG